MAMLIAVALLIGLTVAVYAVDFHSPGQPITRDPALARLVRELDAKPDTADEANEANEIELTHRLIAGSIDSDTYCRAMSALSREIAPPPASSATTGDPPTDPAGEAT